MGNQSRHEGQVGKGDSGGHSGYAGNLRSWRRLMGGDWTASPLDSVELDDEHEETEPRSPTLWEAELVALSEESLFALDASEDVR